ncbi:flavodoxin family protein [Eilatimonas milleporae]|uniref:Multimeric flavodoxin WrbA n=1 Tax=Eilatimonas milleporae TaxID=911205 RepID=A0A3M0BZK0_9PROT|nr:NAD(P)H-dependent oxidoreductase [Eilatimonas milleporae]RMB02918.1 multimeric flavodoxin WrbA [Eilatimonas milleporae]
MSDAISLLASSRRNGNTGKLIDWIAGDLGGEVIDITALDISPYDYDHKNIHDDFIPVMKKVLEYDSVIFATPVYWYAPSAQMKIFIDRISDFLDIEDLKDIGRKLRKKTAYIVCTSIGEEADDAFLGCFKSTFGYLGMKYGGHLHANCENGFEKEKNAQKVENFVGLIRARKTL